MNQISKKLHENERILLDTLGESADLQKRPLLLKDQQVLVYYTDGLVNNTDVQNILKCLIVYGEKLEWKEHHSIEAVRRELLTNGSVKAVKQIDQAVHGILSGDTIIFIDGYEEGLLVSTRGWAARSVSEPATENVVRGPRDGFTESIRTNTALVRRRIRDPRLRFDKMNVGTRSKTDLNIAYVQGVVKEGLVEEVKSRLERIDLDAVLESGYIEELIEDSPYSPFNTLQSTERPDKVAAAILEGRVAIFVDNTPFVLLAPVYFWQFLQASDDYYSRYWVGSFYRIVRFLAMLISLTLPSLYVMLVSYHHEMIPTGLALTIAAGREIVPFPVLLEALLMEFAFELMREAGLRMPKPVGQAVSIVGSLIIGQAAVQAGVVSPFMVIVVAVTGIASFAIPTYGASFAIRLLRFPLLIASGTLGLFGFAAVMFILILHSLSLRSFGEPFFAPASPFRANDQKDTLVRLPWWNMNKRPQFAGGNGKRGNAQMPEPPKKPQKHDQEREDDWR